ncbi:MAG: peptidase, M16 family protein [Lunatimonas sp.]|uniref:peptidase, M16 family protein n=1 Tax=Lunatimonas sp. TaxID=2060141 RepID=UPI00263BD7A6|nr:peptidase, M16 family protein [Lunatimonas sp.]MCC5937242.1 peptidase, M16 family protein [Lunatimonas sp.]
MQRSIKLIALAVLFQSTFRLFAYSDGPGYSVEDKSPEEIINNYVTAVGGLDKINAVKNMVMVMEANIQGMTLEISSTSDQENKRLVQQTAMNGNVMQKTIVKDGKGFISAMGQVQELQSEQLDAVNAQIYVFPEIHYERLGYTLSSEGESEVEGEKAYVLKIVTQGGIETKEYYSVQSGLKLRTSSEQAGDISYSDYREVDGLKIPYKMTISNAMLPMPIEATLVLAKFNDQLDNSLFE